MTIRLISCSRRTPEDFTQTLLGQTLPLLKRHVKCHLFLGNDGPEAKGLSELYNRFITEQYRNDILVFVHDDVAIQDWLLAERLHEAMQSFDVVGVAGNTNPDWSQPSWLLTFDEAMRKSGSQPKTYCSGRILHQVQGKLIHSGYGPWPRKVKALDGLFIAVKTSALLDKKIRFDPQFRFHCYDIDFCRSATSAGLRLGTWPIALLHGSAGNYASQSFRDCARSYLNKWAQKTDTKLVSA